MERRLVLTLYAKELYFRMVWMNHSKEVEHGCFRKSFFYFYSVNLNKKRIYGTSRI